MENKFCTNCGNSIKEGMDFCDNCGKSTANKEKPQTDQEFQPPNEQGFQPPNYQNVNNNQQYIVNELDTPLSVSQWVGTIFLCMIPIAGFVLLIVWAFSSDVNKNKKNFSRAFLIVELILIGIYIIIILLLLFVFASTSYYIYR